MTNKYETVDLGNVKGTQGQTGAKGRGINSIRKMDIEDPNNALIDTYRIYFDDGTTWDYTLKNGRDGDTGDDTLSITSQQPIQNRTVTRKFDELEISINDLINRVTSLEGQEYIYFVQSLPNTPTDRKGLYVVPSQSPTTENTHEEYVWNNINSRWEHIGSFNINLNNYYTKDDINNKISNNFNSDNTSTTKIPSVKAVRDKLANDYYTKSEINNRIGELQDFIHS